VPGYFFSATRGAEAALEKAEQLLKVSKWTCPYRIWNKALTPEQGHRFVRFGVACHILAGRPLSAHQKLSWSMGGNGLGMISYIIFPEDPDTSP
jgi:hypothetical protein